MARTWRAGVIGCGAIGQALHIPGYMNTPGVVLVAGADPQARQRREARRLAGDGFRVYADHRAMLAAETLEVISVCSPNCFHAQHAVAALDAGAHVILEKPPALSGREIERIRRARDRNGRQVVIGFSHRFHRGNRRMHRLIRAGAIGEPYMIRVRFAHRGPEPGWAKSDWFYRPKLAGGGALLDMGIHAIDQCHWLIGPIAAVQARTDTLRKNIPLDDNALLLLEFERPRARGYIDVGWTSPAGFVGIEVMGDAGFLRQDYAGALTLTTGRISPDAKKKTGLKTRVVDAAPTTGGWKTEIQDIIRGLRKGEDLDCGLEAGGAALAVALAAYESSRTGRRVVIRG
ncbi:MAG: dehydrogenase [Phycisphaerae bacterium]